MVCKSRTVLKRDCNRSTESIRGTKNFTNNLNRVLLIYEGFPDLELPGILAIKWGDKNPEWEKEGKIHLVQK